MESDNDNMSIPGMDDLFKEPEPEQISRLNVVSPSRRSAHSLATDAWSVWVKHTRRPPERSTPNVDFLDTYKYWLRAGWDHAHLMDIVHAASFLPPSRTDPLDDVLRVTRAMASPTRERMAKKLRSELNSEPVLFPTPSPDDEDTSWKMEMSQLTSTCGVPMDRWTEEDHDAALEIASTSTLEQLSRAVVVVRKETRRRGIRPHQVMDALGDIILSDTDDGYEDAGAIQLPDSFHHDGEARKMLLRHGKAVALEYHLSVPDPFWEEVSGLVAEGLDTSRAIARASKFCKFDLDTRNVKEP